MKITLLGKRKLGFVTGDCKKESCEDDLHEQWETCNAIVLSWLMNTISTELLNGIEYASNAHLVWEDLKERFDKINRIRNFQLHRAILTLSQGTSSISVDFTRLKTLWVEYDAMVPSPNCGCAKSKDYVDHLHQQKLLQFLSGLNDSYYQARRQILLKTNVPSINQAYAMIIEDETHNSPNLSGVSEKNDPLAMQVNRGQFGKLLKIIATK